jgi:hypothetical protein
VPTTSPTIKKIEPIKTVVTPEKVKKKAPEKAVKPLKPPPEPVVLTADDIDQLVESKSKAIESCYDKARRVNPAVGGKLLIKVTVSDNRIWALIMENELTPEMGNCVARAIRAINPPPSIGSTTILKEILFRTKEP